MIPFKVADTKTSDVKDTKKPETECFKDIKPDSNITPSESKDFWDKKFDSMEKESLEDLVQDYIDDIKSKSDVPDTIPDKPIEASDLRKNTIEENALKREEFALNKNNLIQEWEQVHGREWPTYKEDVYITNKKGEKVLVREAGQRYDAHHIQPLNLGGKNEVSNITPLRADVHYDHRGVHQLGSPYDNMVKTVGGRI